jgi:hypothetical protein
MDFSEALKQLKEQDRVSRASWGPGSGKFVMYQNGYPDGISINQNTAEASGLDVGTVCRFSPYLMIYENEVFMPWLPNLTDLLAEDWYIYY